jgi:hypothetical protein
MGRLALAGAAALIAAVGIAGTASAAGDARADHLGITQTAWRGGFWGPRFRGGVFIGPSIGFGVYAPLWAPPPVYYAPPPVLEQGYVAPQGYAQPPAYGPQADGAGPNAGYWYYCNNPQGYYPYIRECNGQWQTVPANPDNTPR